MQPDRVVVEVGVGDPFRVSPAVDLGWPPASAQWHRNGVPLAGQEEVAFAVNAASREQHEGTYTLSLDSWAGPFLWAEAHVHVQAPTARDRTPERGSSAAAALLGSDDLALRDHSPGSGDASGPPFAADVVDGADPWAAALSAVAALRGARGLEQVALSLGDAMACGATLGSDDGLTGDEPTLRAIATAAQDAATEAAGPTQVAAGVGVLQLAAHRIAATSDAAECRQAAETALRRLGEAVAAVAGG